MIISLVKTENHLGWAGGLRSRVDSKSLKGLIDNQTFL